jgi:hypothetical protein
MSDVHLVADGNAMVAELLTPFRSKPYRELAELPPVTSTPVAGQSAVIESKLLRKPTSEIQPEIDRLVADGFAPVDIGNHHVLLIEHTVEGLGNESDLEKRHRLEARTNEALWWTGLGMCASRDAKNVTPFAHLSCQTLDGVSYA